MHWDVNNEQLHGQFFEQSSGNPWILSYMFNEVRARDADVVLFLNDYEIVSSSRMTQVHARSYRHDRTRNVQKTYLYFRPTVIYEGFSFQAYVQSVYRIEYDGADVGGLGIQSHLVGTPDINSIMVSLPLRQSLN